MSLHRILLDEFIQAPEAARQGLSAPFVTDLDAAFCNLPIRKYLLTALAIMCYYRFDTSRPRYQLSKTVLCIDAGRVRLKPLS